MLVRGSRSYSIEAEIVQFVLDDRAADRHRVLLILVRHHDADRRILRVELAVAEVAAERAGQLIRAGLRHHVDLHALRPALRRVEPVGDELELRDHLLAERRLAAAAKTVGDLHAVEVRLVLADLAAVSVRQWRVRVGR